ncbi:polysaccharide biosynthesis protein [Herbaspirillum sp. BH-1]|uniref:Polysaccharide biosynthesis protein n=2 Tax=Herbaspirillum frisingense TaxID=92645 RepID=A0AAI9IEE9_9BURK|nr:MULTISPECIES: nucleoside-diphosphate sugar epimerase/dehydratase [Herbaspirillum]EOA04519.1 polysaccharide biosynthesis protein [Herbaspirillum frisingense GSF30]MDR6586835.1 FlaA1/EpsC-like NDP-sugar epimerase [Herbaspirillum frisingense]PLY58097.1 polysaccharide biosynthesis protein [Herbaspirillum sp. BH-1]UIN21944.1 polysaccharide biosynthesis protein [Herbaspirillum frisingense]
MNQARFLRRSWRRACSALARPALALPRPVKRIVALTIDLSLCLFTAWLSFYLRLGEFISITRESEWGTGLLLAAVAACLIALPIFIVSGLYRAIFRYSGLPALQTVGRAVGVYGVLYFSIFTIIGINGVPRTVGIIQPILLLFMVGASRALARVWLSDQYLRILKHAARPKVMIYGAGEAGRQLAGALTNSHEMQVAGFLDDDDRLHGHVLNGLPIYNPADLAGLVETLKINDVLLAMPNINRTRRNAILSDIRSAHVSVRTLPSVMDLARGRISVSDLRELDIDDLLGREPVLPNHLLLAKNITGKVVLVTGAGGSIGSELCRQILAVSPVKLLLIEQNEYGLYAIHQELEAQLDGRDIALVPLLASVQDEERLGEILSTWHPHTVYHAAAYKHVPLVEHNPAEGIKNNLLGTLRTARAAIENEVAHFVLVSTDKAVRPTNIMGASKRLAEMALQALASTQPATRISMVRFGNVLGSSGSVVPKFRQQIRNGEAITLTHTDITRYFMTIPEAAQLVIQAGAMAKGGDVFLLDMGQPVKIIDLARRMIELSGLTVRDEVNPDGDIEIQITGLRHGEKLYEELLIGEDSETTPHPRIMKAHEDFMPWPALQERLRELMAALSANDVNAIRTIMQRLVSGYTPSDEIVDWVYMEQETELQRGT